ncbi:hypothetical protein J6590_098370 [Homalodisca vitripennis]|nr:hypothetical protein J6590_098370 [Homalodisca vitripennis]
MDCDKLERCVEYYSTATKCILMKWKKHHIATTYTGQFITVRKTLSYILATEVFLCSQD